jgi:carbamoyltransferase
MMTNIYILGINSAYHESSACLIKNGQIVAVAEEERFNRVKHAKPAKVNNPDELPINTINFCLEKARISLKELSYIGYSFAPEKRLKNIKVKEKVVEGDWGSKSGEELFYQKLQEVPKKLAQLAAQDISNKFHWIDHHLCHASSAFFVSPFKESAVLSVDGIGEFTTTYLGYGTGNKIKTIKEIEYPNSLGLFWEKYSKFLGFTEYDAAKVMGLAAYGNPSRYYNKLISLIEKSNGASFRLNNNIIKFRVNDYSGLSRLLGRKRELNQVIETRHADIAAALQKLTEEILLRIANYLYNQTKTKNLCIAGGVALNCVANRILQENSQFENIYIQPAAHDAGTAIGAAYFIWNQILGKARNYVMDNPFLGPEYSEHEIIEILNKNNLNYSYYCDIERITAKLVSSRKIVAWFQGRMEIGPRALGNRTLLADPRNPKIRDTLNTEVKHREYFRPFAPSVLAEKAEEWFKISKKSLSSDFMLFAYDVVEDKQNLIPAVIHIDGTSRIQTVREETNPKYHKLIQEFEKLTGVPVILNTSFNNDKEPIVCSPKDAVNTFLKTRIDYLVIGNYLASKGESNGN